MTRRDFVMGQKWRATVRIEDRDVVLEIGAPPTYSHVRIIEGRRAAEINAVYDHLCRALAIAENGMSDQEDEEEEEYRARRKG
jgi:hypothetical protein